MFKFGSLFETPEQYVSRTEELALGLGGEGGVRALGCEVKVHGSRVEGLRFRASGSMLLTSVDGNGY